MASIKQLKKEINYLTYELLNECYAYKRFNHGKDEKKINAIISNVLKKRNELIYKIHHTDNITEKKKLKEHYRSIITECNTDLISILDKLNDL
jgi:hypothetical protein